MLGKPRQRLFSTRYRSLYRKRALRRCMLPLRKRGEREEEEEPN